MPIFRYNEQPGNYYAYLIEGSGDDANDGLTPETAVATLDRLVEILDTYAGASARVAVIRKNRIYNEGITYARNTSKPITFEFVGGCEIDGSGATRPMFLVSYDHLIGATIKNYSGSLWLGGNNHNRNQATNCLFLNNLSASLVPHPAYNFYVILNNCIVLDTWLGSVNSQYGAFFYFYNCCSLNVLIHNGLLSNNGTINLIALNSIFKDCPNLKPRWSATGTQFNYNCVYGNIGRQDDRTLLYINDDLVLLGHNLNGISENPQFTDEAFGVYTVKSFSPCLYRGQNAAHIGLGEGFYLTASQLLTNAETNDNFQVSSGRLTFIDPNDNALLQTYPIDAGSFVTIERADLAAIIGTVGADISSTAVVLSHWYPAYNSTYNYHTGAGITDSGIKYKSLQDNNLNQAPATETLYWERMTWESGVSYSSGKIVEYTDGKWYKANTATSTSWVAGEWDEVVLIQQFNFYIKTGRTYDECNDADYSIVPFNDVPLIDVVGKGNSEDDYDPDTGASITFRFISIKIHAKTVL